MKFGKFKMVKCWDSGLEMSKEEEASLLKYAYWNILLDKKALLNWAVNKGLENYIKSLEAKNSCLKKIIAKKNKNKV